MPPIQDSGILEYRKNIERITYDGKLPSYSENIKSESVQNLIRSRYSDTGTIAECHTRIEIRKLKFAKFV